jgi:hypothetical protein
MQRIGFMQNHIYSLLGYYPWICRSCKKTSLLRQRREWKQRDASITMKHVAPGGASDTKRRVAPVISGDERRGVPAD